MPAALLEVEIQVVMKTQQKTNSLVCKK